MSFLKIHVKEIQILLQQCFNSNRVDLLDKVAKHFEDLSNKIDRLLKPEAALILRCIFYPFGVKILELKNERLSMLMVSLINWWMSTKPSDAPEGPLFKMLKQKQVYDINSLLLNDYVANTYKMVIKSSNSGKINLKYLFQLLSLNSTSKQRDSLIDLLRMIISDIEKSRKKMYFVLLRRFL